VILLNSVDLIHSRSYLASFVALVLSVVSGRPFIFDMRAFWPEEMIAAGRLRRGSLTHRIIVLGEGLCLRRAAGVVSLTQAALGYMADNGKLMSNQRAVVIPTCADLTRFVPSNNSGNSQTYGCLGSVTSGWFKLDWLVAFFEQLAIDKPDANFEILSRDKPVRILAAFRQDSAVLPRLTIRSVSGVEVGAGLNMQVASCMFFTSGIAKMASCPTRMGEVLACGKPVVVNEGVGDVAEIIRQFRVGVVVKDDSPESMEAAVFELDLLMLDTGLAKRCRAAAEQYFSLDRGVAKYQALYKEILS
jgi:hypothetical protein